MTPDGPVPVLLALATVVLAAVVLALTWDRVQRLARTALVAAGVLAVLLASALEVNRLTETWAAPQTGDQRPAFVPARQTSGGRIVELTVAGRASGMTMPAYVYLPPGYGTGTPATPWSRPPMASPARPTAGCAASTWSPT